MFTNLYPVALDTFQAVSLGILVKILLNSRLRVDQEALSDTGMDPSSWLIPA
jgi:hypothetical protein